MSTQQVYQVLADKMVEKAIAECAEQNFAGDIQRARQAVQRGSCETCACLSSSLAKQISAYLGEIDKTVKAVYRFEPAQIPEHITNDPGGRLNQQIGINLVAWVDRKSAALSALVETFESALSKSQREIGCVRALPGCYTITLEMVDDQQVSELRGLGLLVENVYVQSNQIWERSGDQPDRIPLGKRQQSKQVSLSLPESFDPQLMPVSRLIHHAGMIENIPSEERASLEPHLTELKVILIRRLISDQLAYINIAKNWFNISDLKDILQRRIGRGKVGGKAAGMLLAAKILEQVADEQLKDALTIPTSYFLGSDLLYIFMAMNGLMHWNEQKYKPEEQIHDQYPQVIEEFQQGSFPPEVLDELGAMLAEIGPQPIIVRSSSQLEDNFGTSFAGKYDSFFCPNQGPPEENLEALVNAVKRTYASTLKPEALLYRRSKELQDYDERMAVMIQVVQGEAFGKYFLPHAAGVAFSRNIYRWAPQIRREDGFMRLVWGLGTRAVERLGNEYPRLVALSHPMLQPDESCQAIRYYSQQYVDLIDLEENLLKTLPIHEVLKPAYKPLRFIAQLEADGYFSTLRRRVQEADIPKLAITFEGFLNRTPFAALMARLLRNLEEHYHEAVDVEFAAHISDPSAQPPEIVISLLQCRPQSHLLDTQIVNLPAAIPEEHIVFSSSYIVPRGHLKDIHYVVFVAPEAYYALPTPEARNKVGRIIGRLNEALTGIPFICIGPGRWGTTNTDLGVFVSYADIYNAGALVELSGEGIGPAPEPSLGTHFFQDLMEAHIYPLAICVDEAENLFNQGFFYEAPNVIADWIEVSQEMAKCVRVIDAQVFCEGCHLELVMDDEAGKAVAFFNKHAQD